MDDVRVHSSVPPPGSITGRTIKDGSIGTIDLANNIITNDKLALGSVSGNVIVANAILHGHLADNSVGSNNIIDGTIIETDVRDAAISGNKIAANSILPGHLSSDLTLNGTTTLTGSVYALSGIITSGNVMLYTGGVGAYQVQMGDRPTTADSTADVVIAATSVSKVPLVIQSKASQTANPIQIQASTGSVVSYISAAGAYYGPGVYVPATGNSKEGLDGNGLHLTNDRYVAWENNAALGAGTIDLSLVRSAVGVVQINNGSATSGGTFSAPANNEAQFTTDTNNLSLNVKSLNQRWSSDAPRNITGIVSGVDGQTHYVWNIGSNLFALQYNNENSNIFNRILTSTGGDLVLSGGNCAVIMYDSSSARWRAAKLS